MACALSQFALAGCGKADDTTADKRKPTLVSIEHISERSVTKSLTLIGAMDSRKSVDLYPRVDGYIASIGISPGEPVRSGQLVIEIDRTKQEAAVAAKRSSVELARSDYAKEVGKLQSMEADRGAKEAQVNFQNLEYQRYYWLEKRGVVPVASVDKEKRDLDVCQARMKSLDAEMVAQKGVIERAKSRIEEAKAELRAEQEQLSYHTIRSPFAGIIGDIPVKVGDYVDPHTKLTTVSTTNPLEVNLQVPKDEAHSLKDGMVMEILADDGHVVGTSKIFYISPTVDLQYQSVLVKGMYDNSSAALRPDQAVKIRILLHTAGAVTVPTEAISFVAGQTFVFVVSPGKDGGTMASQRPVKIEDIQNNRATIASGLKPGENVVVSGIQMLFDGAPVTPRGETGDVQ